MIVVSDTSPIIGLIRIRQINLLHELFNEVVMPMAVYDELKLARFDANETKTLMEFKWLVVKKVSGTTDENNELDKGELEAILLAKELKADILLIDETAGRRAAQSEGLRIVGVIGLLIMAKQKGLVLKVKPLLDELMAKSDFWISERLYQTVLTEADEL